MATHNNRKILGLGFHFYEPSPKIDSIENEKHRSTSHITHKQLNKSRTRAKYNSMFYGY